MNLSNKYALPIANNVSKLRRQSGAASPKAFSEIYLGRHCKVPFSRMHEWMFESLLEMTTKRRARVAIAAPRGHAKSTIVSLAYPLWCALYKKEKYIVLVSNTQEQAKSLLKDIKDELTNNLYLSRDFPEICRSLTGSGKPKPWRDNRIVLPNGIMIAGYGMNQGLRGTKSGSERPGLLIVDDLESRESAIYEEQREKLAEWFHKTLLPAGHPESNVVVVGTVLHQDSLLANLIDETKQPGWTGKKYKAIEKESDHPELWERWSDIYCRRTEFQKQEGPEAAKAFFEANEEAMLEGTKVLWPEWEDYYCLMKMREGGLAAFQAEKQNEPIDPQQCIFTREIFQYWSDDYSDVFSLLEHLGPGCDIFGACDPSMGRRDNRGDYSAVIILCRDKDCENLYVLNADIARRDPDETIEAIAHYARLYDAKWYDIESFAVEVNQFQYVILQKLIRRMDSTGVHSVMDIKEITNTRHKGSRIAGLQPEIAMGTLLFSRDQRLLLEQAWGFPVAKYDDGPDCLEMAVRIARGPKHITIVTQV